MKRQRHARSRGIYAKHITLVGLGAAGRQVALLLAACGVRKLQLVDGGTVRYWHILRQGYFADDVGRHKVHATADICQQISPQLDVKELPHDFRADVRIGEFVFCCENAADVRPRIRSLASVQCQFWGEISLRSDVIRVTMERAHELGDPNQVELPPASRKETVKLPVATIAASLLVQQFMRVCAGQPFDREIVLDLTRGKYLRRSDGGAEPGC